MPRILPGPNFQFPQDFCFIVLRRLDQPHQRMVQTGNALIRSHRRSANSLASMMFQLRAQAVPLSPAARQVQAEASDEATASKATATTSAASIPLILVPLQPTRQCRLSGCGALSAVTSHREANGIRVRQIGNSRAARPARTPRTSHPCPIVAVRERHGGNQERGDARVEFPNCDFKPMKSTD